MDFSLTEEEDAVYSAAKEFGEKRLAPGAAARDRKSEFPQDEWVEMAAMGLLGIPFPEAYEGGGMSTLCYYMSIEEISRGCGATGVILSAHVSLCAEPINQWGTEEQKKKHLTRLCRGDALGCLAVTEPQAGSDVANQKTTAVLDGGDWVLNGSKIFNTNGKEADLAIVLAVTDPQASKRRLSTFIVETDRPGFQVAKIEDKLGIRASSTAELVFTDLRLPQENLLGKRGEGLKVVFSTLDGGRVGIAAQAVGIGRAAIETAARYALGRVQFGKPIAELQAIQWMLAESHAELEAARLLGLRAAFLKDQGARFSKEAAMAKMFASEAAVRAANRGMQIHGGYGYIRDYPAERFLRDAKITEIYEGTNEIMRLIIAQSFLREMAA